MSSPPLSSDPRIAALAAEPLSAHSLEERLDEILDAVLSSRRTAAGLAQAVAKLPRDQQDFVLHWAGVIARTNSEMAYQFAAAAPDALAQLDPAAAEEWIIQAMDTYDRDGLYRGSVVFKNAQDFSAPARAGGAAVTFESVAPVLQIFITGLAGRRLRLDTAPHAYNDTETLHLPPRISAFDNREDNFLLYKALAALMWAQGRYGTFNSDLEQVCAGYPDADRALRLLASLETVRLEACIVRALPGLARDMARLRRNAPAPDARTVALTRPQATVADSVALLARLYPDLAPLEYPYIAGLRPREAAAVRTARIAREKNEMRSALAALLEKQAGAGSAAGEAKFSVETGAAADPALGLEAKLTLDGKPVAPPENVRGLIGSILQDLGEIPDDYLTPAGDGGDRAPGHDAVDPADVWKGVYREQGAFFYNEWDHRRRHYRKNWCVLREIDVEPASPAFVTATLEKYGPQVASLKRTFELLRGEDKLLKRQPHGDDIDLDAVVAAYADMKSGLELPERLLVKRDKAERDLAVMFMVDMSGSTKGWINDAEREALVMLCEALEVLGDRYAIYGFSGITRKRCEIYRVKRFDEPYTEQVRCRIAGIKPQDYTRMGAAIRHLATLLNQVEARVKLMITLSDGKPDDYSDNYRGEYGIEDTRQALIEAHRSGIKPFCITIDREARDYLPHMYGAVNWTLIDDVTRMPLKVADIYRRLTG